MEKIKCEECDVSFTMKKNLNIHLRKKHNKDPLAQKREHIIRMRKFMCEECDASFTMKKNLYFHVRKKHSKDPLSQHRMGRIMCEDCDASFTLKRNLYCHMRKIHNKDPLAGIKEHRVIVMCKECDASFSMKKNLYSHMRKVSGKDPSALKKEGKVIISKKKNSLRSRMGCPIENCHEHSTNHANLRKHLKHDHEIEIDCGEFEFDSFAAFQDWKDKVEEQGLSSYVRQSSFTLQTDGDQKGFLECHRSYSYNTKGYGLRPIKNIGTNKIGKACPSRMEVLIKNQGQGPIYVKFWMTHVGHTLEVERIYSNKKTRAKIADKIMNGETYDEILDEFRSNDSLLNKQQRIQLLNKKDIRNIVRDFELDELAEPADKYLELEVESMESGQNYSSDDTRDEVPQQLKPSIIKECIAQTIVPVPSPDFEVENMDEDIIFEVVELNDSQQPQPAEAVQTQQDIKKKADLIINLCKLVSLTDEECRNEEPQHKPQVVKSNDLKQTQPAKPVQTLQDIDINLCEVVLLTEEECRNEELQHKPQVVESKDLKQTQPPKHVQTQQDIEKKAELFINLCKVVSLTDKECRSISFHFDKIIETIMNKNKIVNLKSKSKLVGTDR